MLKCILFGSIFFAKNIKKPENTSCFTRPDDNYREDYYGKPSQTLMLACQTLSLSQFERQWPENFSIYSTAIILSRKLRFFQKFRNFFENFDVFKDFRFVKISNLEIIVWYFNQFYIFSYQAVDHSTQKRYLCDKGLRLSAVIPADYSY